MSSPSDENICMPAIMQQSSSLWRRKEFSLLATAGAASTGSLSSNRGHIASRSSAFRHTDVPKSRNRLFFFFTLLTRVNLDLEPASTRNFARKITSRLERLKLAGGSSDYLRASKLFHERAPSCKIYLFVYI